MKILGTISAMEQKPAV